jgi:hypothetical protein
VGGRPRGLLSDGGGPSLVTRDLALVKVIVAVHWWLDHRRQFAKERQTATDRNHAIEGRKSLQQSVKEHGFESSSTGNGDEFIITPARP